MKIRKNAAKLSDYYAKPNIGEHGGWFSSKIITGKSLNF
jgi:hypothetical protein